MKYYIEIQLMHQHRTQTAYNVRIIIIDGGAKSLTIKISSVGIDLNKKSHPLGWPNIFELGFT